MAFYDRSHNKLNLAKSQCCFFAGLEQNKNALLYIRSHDTLALS